MGGEADRAAGALLGGALGDAVGMPAQTLTPEAIRAAYGRIAGFVAPCPGHPVASGLGPAQVTDDTEQTLLLARRLIAGGGRLDPGLWAADLVGWEVGVRARGLADLLGPSTQRALAALAAGVAPAEAGRHGTTNGAAMRIAPVAIATPAEPLAGLLDAVEDACRPTHNTAEAIAGAAAVAAVITAGVGGAGFAAALPLALAAAREGARRGHPVGALDMGPRIAAALALAAEGVSAEALAAAVGTTVATAESVPAAFGLLRLAGGEVWPAALMAANIGGDTDTIGAIAGAMGGACAGASALPAGPVAALHAANALEVAPLVAGLIALRARARAAA